MSLRTAFAYSVNTAASCRKSASAPLPIWRRFGITTKVNTHPFHGAGLFRARDRHDAGLCQYRKCASLSTRTGLRRARRRSTPSQSTHQPCAGGSCRREMTDLLQTTVNTGTGKAAQIGRPVAGRPAPPHPTRMVGSLASSGLTTGVWMGRDAAKLIAEPTVASALARALYCLYEVVAVANRSWSSSSYQGDRLEFPSSSPTRIRLWRS